MTTRVLILSAGIGSGHNSAAAALEVAVGQEPGVGEIRTIDILDAAPELYRDLYDDGYFALVRSAPWLVGWGYDASDHPFRGGGTMPLWDQVNNAGTVRAIRAFEPDLVLCTHFIPARLVALMQTWGAVRATMGVVTTDFDFQGFWLSNTFAQLFLAREEAKEHLVSLGVPRDRIAVTGIPVRRELSAPFDPAAARKRLGLRPDSPVLLVSAGAAGGPYASTIVRQLLEREEPFQAVVVCGRNEELRAEIEELVGPHTDRFTVLGYTTDMPDLMRVAHLFVGKPGGLSSSECMAAGLPMVLIDPIPGQEVRNSDFLLEQGAAVRCNFDTTIGWKIGELLADPPRIQAMARRARATGHPDAAATVAREMLGDDGNQLWISDRAQRTLSRTKEPGEVSPERRLRTLVDPDSGRSVGLITESQREKLARTLKASRNSAPERLDVARSDLRSLQGLRVDPFLLLTLHRILGSRRHLSLGVQ